MAPSSKFGTIAGKPYIGGIHSTKAETFVPLDVIGNDPPAPLVMKRTPGPVACDGPPSPIRAGAYLSPDEQVLSVRVEEEPPLTPSPILRVTHPTPAGTECTTAYPSNDWTLFLDAKGYSGVLHETVTDPKTSKSTRVVQPVTCTATK